MVASVEQDPRDTYIATDFRYSRNHVVDFLHVTK